MGFNSGFKGLIRKDATSLFWTFEENVPKNPFHRVTLARCQQLSQSCEWVWVERPGSITDSSKFYSSAPCAVRLACCRMGTEGSSQWLNSRCLKLSSQQHKTISCFYFAWHKHVILKWLTHCLVKWKTSGQNVCARKQFKTNKICTNIYGFSMIRSSDCRVLGCKAAWSYGEGYVWESRPWRKREHLPQRQQ